MKFIGNKLQVLDFMYLVLFLGSVNGWCIHEQPKLPFPVLAVFVLIVWLILQIKHRNERKKQVRYYAKKIVDELLNPKK